MCYFENRSMFSDTVEKYDFFYVVFGNVRIT